MRFCVTWPVSRGLAGHSAVGATLGPASALRMAAVSPAVPRGRFHPAASAGRPRHTPARPGPRSAPRVCSRSPPLRRLRSCRAAVGVEACGEGAALAALPLSAPAPMAASAPSVDTPVWPLRTPGPPGCLWAASSSPASGPSSKPRVPARSPWLYQWTRPRPGCSGR